jgi:hypothetical protein
MARLIRVSFCGLVLLLVGCAHTAPVEPDATVIHYPEPMEE